MLQAVKSRKIIHGVKDHEDHKGQSLATNDHGVIKHWAQERQAVPATIPGTEHQGHPEVLRFNFPGYSSPGLMEITWDDWFKAFDERDLTFLYQEHLKNGHTSNFFKLDSPNR